MKQTSEFLALFDGPRDEERRAKLLAGQPLRRRYLIAFTPRSGSSYLCDVLSRTDRLGKPGELLSRDFLPAILKNCPSADPDEYLSNVLKARRTGPIAGLKASWFQFQQFTAAMSSPEVFDDFKVIYLTRRDLAAQAVSLYRATATDVFHTNIAHSADKLAQLAELPYDYAKIDYWRQHIEVQERGWQDYFARKNIFPLCISYEDIEADIHAVTARLTAYLRLAHPVESQAAAETSVFKKLGESRSVRWAARYRTEHDTQQRRALGLAVDDAET